MRFPWQKREVRQDSLTELLIANLVNTATGQVTSGLSSAIEVASGHWQRAWSRANITPAGPVADAVRPFLGYIGRQMVREGEAVFYLETEGGTFQLLPVCACTITGESNPASWQYEVTLAGPSTTLTRTVGGTGYFTFSTRGRPRNLGRA